MADPAISLEILRRLGFDISGLSVSSVGNHQVHCAFHPDNTPSGSVDIDKGVYHCFSCGEADSLRTIYYRKTGEGIYTTLGIKDPEAGLDSFARAARRGYVETDYESVPSVDFSFVGTALSVRDSKDCMAFLEMRGIPVSMAERMKMSFTEDAKTIDNRSHDPDPLEREMHYKNRLLIPIYAGNKLISLEGRAIYPKREGDTKYKKCIYPKGSSTGTIYQYEKLDKNQPLYVVEGLLDLAVLRTDDFFKNSTALFGASIGNRQLYLLKMFKHIVYVMDDDKAGYTSLKKLKKGIPFDFYVLFPPFRSQGVKDVGDIPQKTGLTIQEVRERKWLNSMRLASSIDEDALIKAWEIAHPPKAKK